MYAAVLVLDGDAAGVVCVSPVYGLVVLFLVRVDPSSLLKYHLDGVHLLTSSGLRVSLPDKHASLSFLYAR